MEFLLRHKLLDVLNTAGKNDVSNQVGYKGHLL